MIIGMNPCLHRTVEEFMDEQTTADGYETPALVEIVELPEPTTAPFSPYAASRSDSRAE
ncbi:hypothetical protein ABZ805_21225 [Saccharopolyspora sp. NPDC047091]|uniref:hypothetical protein n=1 Tax=Saccharopolyspora sp. NPDC047091 TaxID=3155924 RepID=UPI0033DE202E